MGTPRLCSKLLVLKRKKIIHFLKQKAITEISLVPVVQFIHVVKLTTSVSNTVKSL